MITKVEQQRGLGLALLVELSRSDFNRGYLFERRPAEQPQLEDSAEQQSAFSEGSQQVACFSGAQQMEVSSVVGSVS